MGTTIVVAASRQIVRQGMRTILDLREDFDVVGEASDGEAAVHMVLEKQPDVVLMETQMPRLSALRAARRIHQRGLDTKILLLSVQESPPRVEEVLSAGAAGYMDREASAGDLFSAIDTVRAGAFYLSPTVTQRVLAGIAHPAKPDGAASLTRREREVLELVTEGLSSKKIANMLSVSSKTVDTHRAHIMEKLGVHKASGLVRYAIRAGLVEP